MILKNSPALGFIDFSQLRFADSISSIVLVSPSNKLNFLLLIFNFQISFYLFSLIFNILL